MTEDGVVMSSIIDPWKNFKKVEAYDFNGMDDVIADSDEVAPGEIYNLNGVKVGTSFEGIAHGFYIVRQGGMVKKIAVK